MLSMSVAAQRRITEEADEEQALASEQAVDEEDNPEDPGPSTMNFRQSFASAWQSPAANSAAALSRSTNTAGAALGSSLLAPGDGQHAGANEQTPLLPTTTADKDAFQEQETNEAVKSELWLLIAWSTPICITHLLELSLVTVTVVSVGHLGTLELAAASLASMTANVVALSFIQGTASALDTVRAPAALFLPPLLLS